jgi:hypothetical protein
MGNQAGIGQNVFHFFGTECWFILLTGASQSNFIGFSAGYERTAFLVQILLVLQAGNQATNAENSNFMGNQAGRSNRVFLTQISLHFQSGFNATGASTSKFGQVCWVRRS